MASLKLSSLGNTWNRLWLLFKTICHLVCHYRKFPLSEKNMSHLLGKSCPRDWPLSSPYSFSSFYIVCFNTERTNKLWSDFCKAFLMPQAKGTPHICLSPTVSPRDHDCPKWVAVVSQLIEVLYLSIRWSPVFFEISGQWKRQINYVSWCFRLYLIVSAGYRALILLGGQWFYSSSF